MNSSSRSRLNQLVADKQTSDLSEINKTTGVCFIHVQLRLNKLFKKTLANTGADFCFCVLGPTLRARGQRPLPSQLGGLGERRQLVQRGRAPAADEFAKFWSLQNASAET